MSQTSAKRAASKPSNKPGKPRPDFPLYAHRLGYWSKKIDGQIRHFGRWGRMKKGEVVLTEPDGWKEAERIYLQTVQKSNNGHVIDAAPVVTEQSLTEAPSPSRTQVRDVCNAFLTAKHKQLASGEITAPTFVEYRAACEQIVAYFRKYKKVASLRQQDFAGFQQHIRTELKYGPVRLGKVVNLTRYTFKWVYDNTDLLEKPMKFGDGFEGPKQKELRAHKHKTGGTPTFTAAEIRLLLDNSKPQLRAMILLGINCGYGNTDVSELQQSVIEWDKQEIFFPRPKTAIDRRAVLWPETVEALKVAIAQRPAPADAGDAGLVFLTRYGNRFVRWKQTGEGKDARITHINSVRGIFGTLLRKLDINGRRRIGFYSLRHTFADCARHVRDDSAVKVILGHSQKDMLNSHYTHEFPRERLAAVAEHVRRWLFGEDQDAKN